MTLTLATPMTMKEYVNYAHSTDIRYELVNGELAKMPSESFGNISIAKFLLFELAKYLPLILIAYNTEVEVSGRKATCRTPDLLIHSEESVAAVIGAARNLISLDMPPPVLVIEVVSPGQENRDRDYRYKRTEYAARGINEYWIIDPELQQVTICEWIEGQYEDKIYTEDMAIASTIVSGVTLTANEILIPAVIPTISRREKALLEGS